MNTNAQVAAPAAHTRKINVLQYVRDGKPVTEPYTRFSELTKKQAELLKDGIEVTVRPAQATIETKVSLIVD